MDLEDAWDAAVRLDLVSAGEVPHDRHAEIAEVREDACVALTKLHWVPSSLHATGVVTLAITAAAFAAHRASTGSAGGALKAAA